MVVDIAHTPVNELDGLGSTSRKMRLTASSMSQKSGAPPLDDLEDSAIAQLIEDSLTSEKNQIEIVGIRSPPAPPHRVTNYGNSYFTNDQKL